jgi:hypothetical protein
MLAAVLKFASNMVNPEVKDRSNDIMNLFMTNRRKSETTFETEIAYRKQVEKLSKDGDLYRIVYVSGCTDRLIVFDTSLREISGPKHQACHDIHLQERRSDLRCGESD